MVTPAVPADHIFHPGLDASPIHYPLADQPNTNHRIWTQALQLLTDHQGLGGVQ
jgi:hypothetical protein